MQYGLSNSVPVSNYRCRYCNAAAWVVYPKVIPPHRQRIQYVHVTHDKECLLGIRKETEWGMPRVL